MGKSANVRGLPGRWRRLLEAAGADADDGEPGFRGQSSVKAEGSRMGGPESIEEALEEMTSVSGESDLLQETKGVTGVGWDKGTSKRLGRERMTTPGCPVWIATVVGTPSR